MPILPFGLGTKITAAESFEVPGDEGDDDNDDGLSWWGGFDGSSKLPLVLV